MSLKNMLLIVAFLFISYFSYSQSNNPVCINSNETLRREIKKIIGDQCQIDSSNKNKIIFTFKIDSLGEIHSAHIRKAENLKVDCYYNIVRILESKFNVKYLFDSFKEDNYGKYVKIDFPYYE